MASVTSAPSPPSPSNSGNSATQPALRTSSHHQGSAKDAATNNGVPDAIEKKSHSLDAFEDMNGDDEYIERFINYEADYTRRLMAKYFSDKDIYGGNIFDESMTIDGKTIKASRWHCALSYADPVQFLKEKSTCSSASPANTSSSISNGKHSTKEDG